MSEIICESCGREDDCIPRMLCTACHKNLTGIAECCGNALNLQAENKKLKKAINGALAIKDIWLPNEDGEGYRSGEYAALSIMEQSFDDCLKD